MRGCHENIPVWASLAPNDNIHFGKNDFEQGAESVVCDEYFINEDMLAGPLDTYGRCVVSAGINMHYIQEYLNRALGYCPDIQNIVMIRCFCNQQYRTHL